MRRSLVRRLGMRDPDGAQAQGGESNADQGLRREDASKHCVCHDILRRLVSGMPGEPPGLDGRKMDSRAENDNPVSLYWIYAPGGAMRSLPSQFPRTE